MNIINILNIKYHQIDKTVGIHYISGNGNIDNTRKI